MRAQVAVPQPKKPKVSRGGAAINRMNVKWKESGQKVCFVVTELDPIQSRAVKDLGFSESQGGYARCFPSDHPMPRDIFERFSSHIEEMVSQSSGTLRPNWESALESFLQRMTPRNVPNWWLTGSPALAVKGIEVVPHDIDLVVATGNDAQELGRVMSDWLVEPIQQSRGWVARWFGRAFKDARIEWVGDVDASVDQPEPSDFGPTAAARLQTVRWRGFTVMVPPIELQLAVCVRRGMTDRAKKIREMIV